MKALQSNGFVWKNVFAPSERIIRKIGREYNFHPLTIEDCLASNQRPKIDDYELYLFIVLHVPKVGGDGRLTIDEIDICIGQDFFITVHQANPWVMDLFKRLSGNEDELEKKMGKGTGFFLYEFIDELLKRMFAVFDCTSSRAVKLEQDLFGAPGREDMLTNVLFLEKDLIVMSRIIVPQRATIAQLEHKKTKFLTEQHEPYFEDLVDKIERLYINVESLKDVGRLLRQTNELVISHKTSSVIKILTIFSVFLLPMTVITGIYGMNLTTIPFLNHPLSFYIVIFMMAGVVGTMLLYFIYKKWF